MPVVTRKSALTAKVDAVIEELDSDPQKLSERLRDLENQVNEANMHHE